MHVRVLMKGAVTIRCVYAYMYLVTMPACPSVVDVIPKKEIRFGCCTRDMIATSWGKKDFGKRTVSNCLDANKYHYLIGVH